MSDPITSLIHQAMARGVQVPPQAISSMQHGLDKFGSALDDKTKQDLLEKFLGGLKSIVKPAQVQRENGTATEGDTPSTLSSDVEHLLKQFGTSDGLVEELNLPFKVDVATNVMRGGARFLADNYDQDELDAYPAWELLRVYQRDVPRGFKRGPKGSLIPVPDDDWPSRFTDACNAAGDDDALGVFKSTGRMIALKSSGVWQELGTNRDDCLGNPFPPFAFNSGYDCDGVSRKECEQLGLLDPGDKPERADIDFSNLFQLPK